jgi:hypothetical protein
MPLFLLFSVYAPNPHVTRQSACCDPRCCSHRVVSASACLDGMAPRHYVSLTCLRLLSSRVRRC